MRVVLGRFLGVKRGGFDLAMLHGAVVGLVAPVPGLLLARAQEGVAEDLEDVESDRHEEDDAPRADGLLEKGELGG